MGQNVQEFLKDYSDNLKKFRPFNIQTNDENLNKFFPLKCEKDKFVVRDVAEG